MDESWFFDICNNFDNQQSFDSLFLNLPEETIYISGINKLYIMGTCALIAQKIPKDHHSKLIGGQNVKTFYKKLTDQPIPDPDSDQKEITTDSGWKYFKTQSIDDNSLVINDKYKNSLLFMRPKDKFTDYGWQYYESMLIDIFKKEFNACKTIDWKWRKEFTKSMNLTHDDKGLLFDLVMKPNALTNNWKVDIPMEI
nr:hypothetical protein [Abalone asfa-like virus]